MVVTYYIKLFRTGDDRQFYWYVNVSSPSSRRDKNNNNWTFLIFFTFSIMFPLELERLDCITCLLRLRLIIHLHRWVVAGHGSEFCNKGQLMKFEIR